MKTFKLKGKNEIPALGLGTWRLSGSGCEKAMEIALETGYRHIDTAEIYGNHKEIGRSLERSQIKRKDVFITSKVPQSKLWRQDTIDSCKRALDELRTDYLDLFLVHWPNRTIPIEETLEAMEELKGDGLIKSYGISNFTIEDIKNIPERFTPVTNQVEFHPSLNQKELKDYCDKKDILITAYSPLAKGEDFGIKEVRDIAQKHNATEAQVIIAWLIAKNIIAIPKAQDKEHIKENFGALRLDLDKEDMKLMEGLDKDNRIVNPGFFR